MPAGRPPVSPKGYAKRIDLSFSPEDFDNLEWLLNRGYASKSEVVRIALSKLVADLKTADDFI